MTDEERYNSLTQYSKQYLEAYISDTSRTRVLALERAIPAKDRSAIRVLLEGVRAAYRECCEDYYDDDSRA